MRVVGPVLRESSVPELARLVMNLPLLAVNTPLGYGRPVLLVPGFGSTDASLELLARWLRSRGYRTYRSGVGINAAAAGWHARRLERRLERIAAAHAGRVAIVGHSRGGVLAAELAAARPDLVAGIVTLGSPNSAGWVGALAGARASARFPRSVAWVSICSPRDRVVRWRSCAHPSARNVAIDATHLGLAHNAEVYRTVGEVLPTFWRGSEGRGTRIRKQLTAWARVAAPL